MRDSTQPPGRGAESDVNRKDVRSQQEVMSDSHSNQWQAAGLGVRLQKQEQLPALVHRQEPTHTHNL